MKTYADETVRKKVEKFIKSHPTRVAAAKAASITKYELSIASKGGRIPAKLLAVIGLQKIEVYTDA